MSFTATIFNDINEHVEVWWSLVYRVEEGKADQTRLFLEPGETWGPKILMIDVARYVCVNYIHVIADPTRSTAKIQCRKLPYTPRPSEHVFCRVSDVISQISSVSPTSPVPGAGFSFLGLTTPAPGIGFGWGFTTAPPGLGWGMWGQTTRSPTAGFSWGLNQATTAPPGLGWGMWGQTTRSPTAGFSWGLPQATTAPTGFGLQLGWGQTTPSPFGFQGWGQTTPPPTTGFSFQGWPRLSAVELHGKCIEFFIQGLFALASIMLLLIGLKTYHSFQKSLRRSREPLTHT